MSQYLYEVRLKGSASNKNKTRFFNNVAAIGAVATDHGGISVLCAVSSHKNAQEIKDLCTFNFRPQSTVNDVTVVEITAVTVADSNHPHSAYGNVVRRFYKPGVYPHIP
jgi:hypothetical protein